MNDYEKLNTLVQIAKLYYLHNMGQQAIADKLKISRSYVSKLLIEARELGVVEVKIRDVVDTESAIEASLREKFKLKKAIVVPVEVNEFDKKLEAVSIALSRYLYNIVGDYDIIGVSWGVTLHVCAQKLAKKPLKGVIVTQLYGGLTHVEKGVHASEIVTNFARAFGATPYFMPLPAIVDSEEMRDTIIKDRSVANVLDLALKSQIAVFSVGGFGMDSSLVRAGYFTEGKVEELQKKGVVGDACARLFNIEGEIVKNEFEKRTIGVPLDNLRRKKYSILVLADDNKAKGTYGILKGGYANVIVTDEITARAVLSLCK